MDFYAEEVERIDHPMRASLEPSVVPGPPTGETEIPRSDQKVKIIQVLGMPNGSVGNQNRTCQAKYLLQVQMRS